MADHDNIIAWGWTSSGGFDGDSKGSKIRKRFFGMYFDRGVSGWGDGENPPIDLLAIFFHPELVLFVFSFFAGIII